MSQNAWWSLSDRDIGLFWSAVWCHRSISACLRRGPFSIWSPVALGRCHKPAEIHFSGFMCASPCGTCNDQLLFLPLFLLGFSASMLALDQLRCSWFHCDLSSRLLCYGKTRWPCLWPILWHFRHLQLHFLGIDPFLSVMFSHIISTHILYVGFLFLLGIIFRLSAWCGHNLTFCLGHLLGYSWDLRPKQFPVRVIISSALWRLTWFSCLLASRQGLSVWQSRQQPRGGQTGSRTFLGAPSICRALHGTLVWWSLLSSSLRRLRQMCYPIAGFHCCWSDQLREWRKFCIQQGRWRNLARMAI